MAWWSLSALEWIPGWLLAGLVVWIIVSGLDDLFIDVSAAWLTLRGARTRPPPRAGREACLAVGVPCWQESAVIESMIEHNLAALRYTGYAFFIGVYPNDAPTLAAARSLARRFSQVHVCVVPHDGPTSKADCLNWIWQHVLAEEERTGIRYDALVLQDAEDVVHPGALARMNDWLAAGYDMVQLPVLALPTPGWKLTHGVYLDEFAETHAKDLDVRQRLGGFVPGCGVGTAVSRRALDRLTAEHRNQVFDPASLTEDYDLGLRLHELQLRQVFVPLGSEDCAATREYFPQRLTAAIRQRTRWVIGNALQAWEHHGWGRPRDWYWFWRDRKGLAGAPLTLLANALYACSLASGWRPDSDWLRWAGAAGLLFQCERLLMRAWFHARFYGWGSALWFPPRVLWANVINGTAVLRALAIYLVARVRGVPLRWVKTDHAYPTRAALDLQPAVFTLAPEMVDAVAAQALPRALIDRWNVLPFLIAGGRLFVACIAEPAPEFLEEARQATRLPIRFHAIGSEDFEQLRRAFS